MKPSVLIGSCVVASLFSQEVRAFCLFNCDPSASDAKAVFTNLHLKRKYPNTPYVISKFRKTNGVKRKIFGQDIYELSFKATVKFPSGADSECYHPNYAIPNGSRREKAIQMAKHQSCIIRGITGVYPGG